MGFDFIANPNREETTDDELDIDDLPHGYLGGGDDGGWFTLRVNEDDDDSEQDDVDLLDDDDEDDDFDSDPFYDQDDFLSMGDSSDSDGELRGIIVDGVFYQTGGANPYNTRSTSNNVTDTNVVMQNGNNAEDDSDASEESDGALSTVSAVLEDGEEVEAAQKSNQGSIQDVSTQTMGTQGKPEVN